MVKKVFGYICLFFCVGEFVAGIGQTIAGETIDHVMGFILATIFFGVLTFFLLKPSKKNNAANSNSPSNKQSNASEGKAVSVVKKVIGVFSLFEIFFSIYQISQSKTTSQIISSVVAALVFTALAFFLLRPTGKKTPAGSDLPSYQQSPPVNPVPPPYQQSIPTTPNPPPYAQSPPKAFSPTKQVPPYIAVDEINKRFQIGANLFEYDNLLSYNLNEDSYAATVGGIGQAVDSVCRSMQLRVNLKNAPIDTTCITFISGDTKKNSPEYKQAQINAQSCASLLAGIAQQIGISFTMPPPIQNVAPQLADAIEEFGKLFQSLNSAGSDKQTQAKTTAPIDEFEKLYHLLHSGLITQEEFDAKKKQLLGL